MKQELIVFDSMSMVINLSHLVRAVAESESDSSVPRLRLYFSDGSQDIISESTGGVPEEVFNRLKQYADDGLKA